MRRAHLSVTFSNRQCGFFFIWRALILKFNFLYNNSTSYFFTLSLFSAKALTIPWEECKKVSFENPRPLQDLNSHKTKYSTSTILP